MVFFLAFVQLAGLQWHPFITLTFYSGLFVMYLLTDQLYGNYFMAVGSYFLVGVAASMRSNLA